MRISDLQIHGLEESAYPSVLDLPCPEPLANGVESGPRSLLVVADQIKIQAVDWIWKGWLAARKFHILGAGPGAGKTTIALKVASTISTGSHWPDGSFAPQGKVVLWSGEDGVEDILVPRLKAAGADLSNILFVGEVPDRGSRQDRRQVEDPDMGERGRHRYPPEKLRKCRLSGAMRQHRKRPIRARLCGRVNE